ncbi:MAG: hypothetical protein A2270_02355 [Elusimicrobia bacterium RIFOXYA12_FULL_51_18]|nr:MAG: hypothetical protein A2270_02355 [Elusimicrobia bacterium RIFOXYA12_FULL_51_18]OGS31256.1 MAG: hypothetical protein A2218_07940 [Elusimicrobia bacterium RIFOXYA2_FULL_53_38]
MSLLLRFQDQPRYELRRLTLTLAEICRSIAASGAGTQKRFTRFSNAVTRARPLMRETGPGRTGLLAQLETAGACLERTFLDLRLHELKPDDESIEVLLFTERALQLHADFISRPASNTSAEAAKNLSSASKGLALALRAVKTDDANFIPNLKFSRIYSGLEKTVCAVNDYTELLARTF